MSGAKGRSGGRREGAGRPPEFNAEIADRICTSLSEGKSLRRVCKGRGMPSRRSVYNWLEKYPEFVKDYNKARQEQADWHADEIIEIADKPDLDPNDKRIRVDARKWVASKLHHKRYGDRLEHAGEVGVKLSDFLKGLPEPDGSQS